MAWLLSKISLFLLANNSIFLFCELFLHALPHIFSLYYYCVFLRITLSLSLTHTLKRSRMKNCIGETKSWGRGRKKDKKKGFMRFNLRLRRGGGGGGISTWAVPLFFSLIYPDKTAGGTGRGGGGGWHIRKKSKFNSLFSLSLSLHYREACLPILLPRELNYCFVILFFLERRKSENVRDTKEEGEKNPLEA